MGTKINKEAVEYLNNNDIKYGIIDDILVVDMARLRADQVTDLYHILGNYEKTRLSSEYLEDLIINEFTDEFEKE